jgi:transcriptional regulator with XRE-family HTH domain
MGFYIKQYAREQGMRLGELARKLRMPLSNLSAISSGRRGVSVRLLSRIADFLGCGVSELFEEEAPGFAVYRSAGSNQEILRIEMENYIGCEKGWTHRLTFSQQKHFKTVRDKGVSYGAGGMDADPWSALFERLNKSRVDYVVIGMSGINYYARSAMETFGTQDYDIFLRPAFENAAKALTIFHELGYETTTADGPVTNKNLRQVVRKKKTILSVNPGSVTFELLFAVSGFVFRQMAGDATVFRVGESVIRVARLQKLLASKEAAGRPKDKLFLKRYEMILKKQKLRDSNSS